MKVMPGDRQHRLPVHLCVVQTIEQMYAAGSRSGQAHAQPPRELGIATRHEGGCFLMPHLHKANLILPRTDRLHDSIDAVAGQTKNDFDAPVADRVNENIAASFGHVLTPAAGVSLPRSVTTARSPCKDCAASAGCAVR